MLPVIRRLFLLLGLLAGAAVARAGWVRVPVLGADVTAIATDRGDQPMIAAQVKVFVDQLVEQGLAEG